MRGEVRAKERGVWWRRTNRHRAGNGTNHGYSSRALLLPPYPPSPLFFLYISILFTSFFLITLFRTPTPPSFHRRRLRRLPHESCDWASCTSLSLGSTSTLATTSLQFPPQPQLGFLSFFFSFLSFLHPLPNTLLTLIHCPPFFAQFTPLGRIIMPSAVTKEMHTPSITMYKFSARGFGRVLIKKPFHPFSSEIIRLSSHQDATSIDLFFSTRKSIGEREKKHRINSRIFNHSPSGYRSIIKDI